MLSIVPSRRGKEENIEDIKENREKKEDVCEGGQGVESDEGKTE